MLKRLEMIVFCYVFDGSNIAEGIIKINWKHVAIMVLGIIATCFLITTWLRGW